MISTAEYAKYSGVTVFMSSGLITESRGFTNTEEIEYFCFVSSFIMTELPFISLAVAESVITVNTGKASVICALLI